MLKLKLQYFGHLMQRVDSLEKTLMQGTIEGKRRRRQQRIRWLDSITNSMDMSLSKLLLLLLLSHIRQPNRLLCPWDSPGKNTGVGFHCLLQCMKVKSKSGVAQSCPTLSDPMDCSLPGSSVHGILQARILEWVAVAFSKMNLAVYNP